jgi:hypothetical protein
MSAAANWLVEARERSHGVAARIEAGKLIGPARQICLLTGFSSAMTALEDTRKALAKEFPEDAEREGWIV